MYSIHSINSLIWSTIQLKTGKCGSDFRNIRDSSALWVDKRP